MEQNIDFWKVVAKYEDVSADYPFDDYMSLDRKDIDMERRFGKVITHLEWMISVLKNAQSRYDSKVDMKKWSDAVEKVTGKGAD